MITLHKFYFSTLVCMLTMLSVINSKAALKTDNLIFKGSLVAVPCTLWPDDELITVNFGTIIDRYLYTNGRTPSIPFAIHLKDCDTSLNNNISISFIGNEHSTLDGLLSLDNSSQASGIAIGLETSQGNPFDINKPSKYPIKNGDMTIDFQAYVRGEPEALSEHSIVKGEFAATVAFRLSYD